MQSTQTECSLKSRESVPGRVSEAPVSVLGLLDRTQDLLCAYLCVTPLPSFDYTRQISTFEAASNPTAGANFKIAHDERFLQLAGPDKREMPADLPAERQANAQFARTLLQLRDYSLTENIRRVHSPQHGEKRATEISTLSPA